MGSTPATGSCRRLNENKIQGLVLQDPVRMGYLAVTTMVEHLQGKETKKDVATGEHVATVENMNDPEIKKLYLPRAVSQLVPRLLQTVRD